jgi:DNA adenine methylase
VQYLGGKSRLAKKFAPILDAALLTKEGRLVEPFVGGFNIVPALTEVKEAVCTDIHPGLIRMYQALQDGWQPPTDVSEEEHAEAKALDDKSARSAFISFACSFSGMEWSGYARGGKRANGEPRNYAAEGARSLTSKFPMVTPCLFKCLSFSDIPELKPAVFYCDPPYRGTTGYKTGAFDHARFDSWCESLVECGHDVFVSEFNAPEHWDVVWQIERKIHIGGKKTKTDKLFRVTPKQGVTS